MYVHILPAGLFGLVILIWNLWLTFDRAELLDRCDQATDNADRALAAQTRGELMERRDPNTEPIPVIEGEPTEPSDLPLQVQTALIATRPSPTPRDQIPTVERELGGRVFTFRAAS